MSALDMSPLDATADLEAPSAPTSGEGARPFDALASGPRDASPEMLAWRSWPLLEEGRRAAALAAIIVALSVGIGASFESAGWGAFSAAVLAAFLAPYLAPTDIALDARGARVRFLGRESFRRWCEVRGLYAHREGVFLSPFARPSRLDPFRGVFLRFSGGNQHEVRSFCERHLRAPPG